VDICKEPNPQLEKWKKFLEKEEFQGDLSDFDSVVSSLPVNEDGSEIRDIKNPMSEIFPHSVDESIPIYHHPLPYVLPSYRQSHFLRSIPEYMVNIDLISEEYLLSLSSLFAYLRLLRNLLLVQIQVEN
jgi:hypothetical protein